MMLNRVMAYANTANQSQWIGILSVLKKAKLRQTLASNSSFNPIANVILMQKAQPRLSILVENAVNMRRA